MKLYIHIGYPKTGSTAIQSHVFANRGWLERNGVYVPRTGYASGFGHAFLVGKSTPLYDRGEKDVRPGDNNRLQDLVAELDQASTRGFQRALLTWEGFSLLEASAIALFYEALQKFDVHLLAYVRDQESLYQSSVLQGLKNLKHFQIGDYFEQGGVRSKDLSYLDYSQTLSRWQELFQTGITVSARIFNRDRLRGSNVVIDFLNELDLEPDDRFALDERAVNPSIDSRSGALILLAYNLGVNYSQLGRLSRTLARVTQESRVKSSEFLEQSDLDYLGEQFENSNRQLYEQFRPDNAVAGETTLPRGKGRDAASPGESELDYLLRVNAALQDPQLEIWEGGPLSNKRVARLLQPPCSGWQAAGKAGVWSQGKRSDIAFRLPKTDPQSGPTAVKVILSGCYYQGNERTLVTIGDRTAEMDLSNAEIDVPLTEALRADGLLIAFEHEEPALAGAGARNGDPDKVGLAYQLQFIAYEFTW